MTTPSLVTPPVSTGRLRALPFRIDGKRLHVAIADPGSIGERDEIAIATKMPVVPHLAPLSHIERQLEAHYGPPESADDES